MKIISPFLMVILIDYTSPTSTLTTLQAYLTAVALTVSVFINLLSSAHFYFWNRVTALHVRSALSAMIYKKVGDKRIAKSSLDHTRHTVHTLKSCTSRADVYQCLVVKISWLTSKK